MKTGTGMRSCQLLLIGAGLGCAALVRAAAPPQILGPARHDGSLLKLRSAALISVGMTTNDHAVFLQTSPDEGRNWLPSAPAGVSWASKVMEDRAGRWHAVWLVARGSGLPAASRFIDIWYAGTSGANHRWQTVHRIWEGYVGALCGRLTELESGRIILPFARWLPQERRGPPHGCNASTVLYTDDGGNTWRESASRLFAPCPENYNGDPVGAVEPVVLRLQNGRVWMLMRTQAGCLYESYSKDGVDWSPAQPTLFSSSTGPAEVVRLPDGRIVLFWNHCELPPRFEGEGVYGGRDALHAAISRDDGQTWRGFREVYLDPTRHKSPPKRGDRGTAYPQFKYLEDDKLIFASGQGESLRVLIALEPDWLEETARADDFSEGLANWSTFKPFGPAKGWWRDRAQGSELLPHPSKPGKRVLHLGKPDEKDAEGAMWNFPAGRVGKVVARLCLNPGFKGASVSLLNHFYDPTDAAGEANAATQVTISADGLVNGLARLQPGNFQDLEISWNTDQARAEVRLGGKKAGTLKVSGKHPFGLSYLRFRSAAQDKDPAGFLIESVRAKVKGR